MSKKLSIIGATGKLAIPIIHRLNSNGVKVTAIVRDLEKAKTVLPSEVKLVNGDLSNVESLKKALGDTETLYLNLSTHKTANGFRPEIDGLKNLLGAAAGTPLKQIIKISAIGALHPEFNLKGELLPANIVRGKSHAILKKSGINYTLFHPTWFLNAVPWFVSEGIYFIYGKDEYPLYWTNTTDFADLIQAAIDNTQAFNRDLPVQGSEPLTFIQAAEKYIKAVNPKLKIQQVPVDANNGKFKLLMGYYEHFKEELVAKETWKLLGSPKLAAEEFIHSTF